MGPGSVPSMTTSTITPQGHPLTACLSVLEEAVDEACTGNPVFLTTDEKQEALLRLTTLRDRIDGLALTVLAVAEDVAAEHGARSPADWLAGQTRSDYGPVARSARLGEALSGRWCQVGDALTQGRLSTAHADAIVTALGALPTSADPVVLAKAESFLVDAASQHTPRQLRILGRRVLELVAPDTFDDHERRVLEAEEARARRRSFLLLRPNHDGTTDLRGRLPDAVAGRLTTYLEAFTSPRQASFHQDGSDPTPPAERRRPYAERLGAAFTTLLERLPSQLLPQHGGTATTVLVTIDLTQLRDDLGAGQLATGGRISAGEARRLACTAHILPAVLGGASQVLDLGRSSRLFSPAQRQAMMLRDRHCRAEGCTIPAAWTEAHHLGTPWSRGGRTDLADGALLCSHHHHRAHDPAYRHDLLADGQLRFRRRRH